MLTLFFLALVWRPTLPAHAERPLPPHAGRFHLGLDVDIYHSSANFQSDGRSHTLLGGASFDHQDVIPHFDFDVSENIRTYANLDYGLTSASNGNGTQSNSGLNTATAGAQWWFYTPYAFVVPQAQITYPFWRVNEGSNNALIGEGAVAAEFGGFAIWRLQPRLQPYAYLGYTYRDVGRSALIPYVVGVNWRPSRWWFEGTLRGFQSASHDTNPDTPGQRDVYLTRVDGGSYHFFAQNPTLTEVNAETGWRFTEGWHAYAGAALAVIGTNSGNGWDVRLGFAYTGRFFERTFAASPRDEVDTPRNFKPSEDKYDETLFEEKRVKMTPIKISPRHRRTEPGVDKMLKDTEKELKGP